MLRAQKILRICCAPTVRWLSFHHALQPGLVGEGVRILDSELKCEGFVCHARGMSLPVLLRAHLRQFLWLHISFFWSLHDMSPNFKTRGAMSKFVFRAPGCPFDYNVGTKNTFYSISKFVPEQWECSSMKTNIKLVLFFSNNKRAEDGKTGTATGRA